MRKTEVILPLSIFSKLDRKSSAPLYFQLSELLEKAILSGQLAAGDRLENEISICERLGLSRPTIRLSLIHI